MKNNLPGNRIPCWELFSLSRLKALFQRMLAICSKSQPEALPGPAEPVGFTHLGGPQLIGTCWTSYTLLPRKWLECCLLVWEFMDSQNLIQGPRLRKHITGLPTVGDLFTWEADPFIFPGRTLILFPLLSSSSDERSAGLCVVWVHLSFQSKTERGRYGKKKLV